LGGGLVQGGQQPPVDPSRLPFAAFPSADHRAVDAEVLLADRGRQGVEPLGDGVEGPAVLQAVVA
jgi:hypothetical protein